MTSETWEKLSTLNNICQTYTFIVVKYRFISIFNKSLMRHYHLIENSVFKQNKSDGIAPALCHLHICHIYRYSFFTTINREIEYLSRCRLLPDELNITGAVASAELEHGAHKSPSSNQDTHKRQAPSFFPLTYFYIPVHVYSFIMHVYPTFPCVQHECTLLFFIIPSPKTIKCLHIILKDKYLPLYNLA